MVSIAVARRMLTAVLVLVIAGVAAVVVFLFGVALLVSFADVVASSAAVGESLA